MLDEDGAFALLMPSAAEPQILQNAAGCGFRLNHRLVVQDNELSKSKRCCWKFSRRQIAAATDETLSIREKGAYSKSFRGLLDSYYLLL